MDFPRLSMQSQRAQIGIQSGHGQLQIEQPKADMRISQPKADMTIHRTEGRLTIDQSEAWAAMDIKSVFQRVRENANYGTQKLMEGIARVAREGDEMLQIHTGRNILVDQAKRRANPPPKDTQITYIPPPFAVKINYTKGDTTVDFTAKRPVINAQVNKPYVNYRPTPVNISLQQGQHLQIDLVK